MWILFLLPAFAVVLSAPTENSHELQMTSTMDSMLKYYDIFASKRDGPEGIDALNKTFDLFYTNPAGVKKLIFMRRCPGNTGSMSMQGHRVNWDPTCTLQTFMNTYVNSLIPNFIKETDIVTFEKNGAANKVLVESEEVTKFSSVWSATQGKTQKKMNCSIILKFQKVAPAEIGLFGMAMDCDTCNFGDFVYGRPPIPF